MGESTTYYLSVVNLSLGGGALAITGKSPPDLSLEKDAIVEILLFRPDVSLRCVARIANKIDVGGIPSQLGVQIIGIDEKSRKVLAEFLHKLANNPPTRSAKGRTTPASVE